MLIEDAAWSRRASEIDWTHGFLSHLGEWERDDGILWRTGRVDRRNDDLCVVDDKGAVHLQTAVATDAAAIMKAL